MSVLKKLQKNVPPLRRISKTPVLLKRPAAATTKAKPSDAPEADFPAPKTVVPRDIVGVEAAPAPRDRGGYDGDTAIKLYLREIGLVKLLTPAEEIELAARIKKGDKKAREHMIKANLRLVVKIEMCIRDRDGCPWRNRLWFVPACSR